MCLLCGRLVHGVLTRPLFFFRTMSQTMRRALAPLETGRTVEDAGILLQDLIDLIGEDVQDDDDDNVVAGLVDTFTTVQLEQIAASIPRRPRAPARKKTTSRVSITKKHENAYRTVRQMR